MTVYRLEPIKTDDPSWQKSSVTKTVWINAESEKEARAKVTSATDVAFVVGMGKPIPKLRSPWDLFDVTSCVPDGSRKVPLDTIITADGEPIPP